MRSVFGSGADTGPSSGFGSSLTRRLTGKSSFFAGTACFTGASVRMYATTAFASSSESERYALYCIIGKSALPFLSTPSRTARSTSPSVHVPIPFSGSGVMFWAQTTPGTANSLPNGKPPCPTVPGLSGNSVAVGPEVRVAREAVRDVLDEIRAAREALGSELDALGRRRPLRGRAKRERRDGDTRDDDEAEGQDENHPHQFFHGRGLWRESGSFRITTSSSFSAARAPSAIWSD